VKSRWSADLDRLVRARYDGGESAKTIARSLKADRRTVRASLERTGHVRTDAETRAVANVLAGREAAVVAMREGGASLREIATAFAVSTGAVVGALRRGGFALDPSEVVRRRARKRSPGASYFQSICDESQAYWLGFIAADGWLRRAARGAQFGLELAARDADHLTLLAGDLDLRVRPTARGKVLITCSNAALVFDLRRAGITERKSSNPELVLALERCPPALRRHFVRGLFDGDGSAFEASNGRRILELSGHATMLSRVRSLVADELAVAWNRLVLPLAGTEFATLRWRHRLDIAKLSLLLYDGATVWLDRKRRVLERPFKRDGASIYRGVFRRRGRWGARIGVGGRGGRVISCGVFDDEVSAARAYDASVRELRGPHAPLNLPDSPFCDPARLSRWHVREAAPP
jgi:Staphylococcus phage endonuclease